MFESYPNKLYCDKCKRTEDCYQRLIGKNEQYWLIKRCLVCGWQTLHEQPKEQRYENFADN